MKILYQPRVKIPKVYCNTNELYLNLHLLTVNNLTECHWRLNAKEM